MLLICIACCPQDVDHYDTTTMRYNIGSLIIYAAKSFTQEYKLIMHFVCILYSDGSRETTDIIKMESLFNLLNQTHVIDAFEYQS